MFFNSRVTGAIQRARNDEFGEFVFYVRGWLMVITRPVLGALSI